MKTFCKVNKTFQHIQNSFEGSPCMYSYFNLGIRNVMIFIMHSVLGSYHQERQADKQDAEVDKLRLDVFLMQYEDSVEEWYQHTAAPDHRDYGYH